MADTAAVASEAAMAGGKKSAWMMHVKKTMRAHKGMSFTKVLKLSAKTYKKTKRGGGVAATAATVGGRRRKTRKTRKGGNYY